MTCDDDDEPDSPRHPSPPPEDKPCPPSPPAPPHDGGGRCKQLAAQVNKKLHEKAHLFNKMKPTDGRSDTFESKLLDIPRIEPWVEISWGDSNCDCIESDDTEIMYLTVGNPYSNLTLSNVIVHEIVVRDASNKAVAQLPNGERCIQLFPVGPYYFDDIPPGEEVSRQFVLRLRGSPGGEHRILLRGVCFNACVHGDDDVGFTFHVCKD